MGRVQVSPAVHADFMGIWKSMDSPMRTSWSNSITLQSRDSWSRLRRMEHLPKGITNKKSDWCVARTRACKDSHESEDISSRCTGAQQSNARIACGARLAANVKLGRMSAPTPTFLPV